MQRSIGSSTRICERGVYFDNFFQNRLNSFSRMCSPVATLGRQADVCQVKSDWGILAAIFLITKKGQDCQKVGIWQRFLRYSVQ